MGVAYYSLAGRTDWDLARDDCAAIDAPPFIVAWADERDPVDPLLTIPEAFVDGGLFKQIPNPAGSNPNKHFYEFRSGHIESPAVFGT